MIRKAVIILLSVLTLVIGFVSVASYACGPNGIFRDMVDTHKSVVVFNAHRGCMGLYFHQIDGRPFATGSQTYDQSPALFKKIETLQKNRKELLVSVIIVQQHFQKGWSNFRFGYALPTLGRRTSALPRDVGYITLPLWFPLLLFAAYPTSAFIRGPLRSRARRQRNQCILCGYNLTGNVSGVCPECGMAIE